MTGADRVTAYGPFYAAVACIAFVLSAIGLIPAVHLAVLRSRPAA